MYKANPYTQRDLPYTQVDLPYTQVDLNIQVGFTLSTMFASKVNLLVYKA